VSIFLSFKEEKIDFGIDFWALARFFLSKTRKVDKKAIKLKFEIKFL
jgi:hypothetical protein